MKALRALMLVLALSVSAYADGNIPNGRCGDIPCGKDGNIPYGRDGDIPYGVAGDMPFGKAGTSHLSSEIALYLLQNVLPLI